MADDEWECKGEDALAPGNKDIFVQLVISFALGISAFIAFCVSPRSPGLGLCITLTCPALGSFFVPDGRHSMPQESDTATPKSHCPSFPIAF